MRSDPRTKIASNKVIYLDLDGVLTDFDRHLQEYLKINVGPTMNFQHWLAVNRVDTLPQSFWATLPWTPYGRQLYAECMRVAPVVILTSPGNNWESSAGKHDWINRELKTRDFIISGQKWLLGNPLTLLIDDRRKNTDAFATHGGRTFLYSDLSLTTYENCLATVKDFIK